MSALINAVGLQPETEEIQVISTCLLGSVIGLRGDARVAAHTGLNRIREKLKTLLYLRKWPKKDSGKLNFSDQYYCDQKIVGLNQKSSVMSD